VPARERPGAGENGRVRALVEEAMRKAAVAWLEV